MHFYLHLKMSYFLFAVLYVWHSVSACQCCYTHSRSIFCDKVSSKTVIWQVTRALLKYLISF